MKFKDCQEAMEWYVDAVIRMGSTGNFDESVAELGMKIFSQGKTSDPSNHHIALADISKILDYFNAKEKAALYMLGLRGFCHAALCFSFKEFDLCHLEAYFEDTSHPVNDKDALRMFEEKFAATCKIPAEELTDKVKIQIVLAHECYAPVLRSTEQYHMEKVTDRLEKILASRGYIIGVKPFFYLPKRHK